MQIKKVDVTPVDLHPREVIRMANAPDIDQGTVDFVRLMLADGRSAWGCTFAHPFFTGDGLQAVLRTGCVVRL